jgi:hypothetical protein
MSRATCHTGFRTGRYIPPGIPTKMTERSKRAGKPAVHNIGGRRSPTAKNESQQVAQLGSRHAAGHGSHRVLQCMCAYA